MYLRVGMNDDNPFQPQSKDYDCIDLNTGIAIPGVQEADDKTGEFSCFLRTDGGKFVLNKLEEEVAIFKFKGNIKLVKKEEFMDEKKVLEVLEETYSTITDIGRKLGDSRVFEKLCPNTPIDEILMTISNMNERLKFIYEQINRLNKEE